MVVKSHTITKKKKKVKKSKNLKHIFNENRRKLSNLCEMHSKKANQLNWEHVEIMLIDVNKIKSLLISN
jgi:hypothetical protein